MTMTPTYVTVLAWTALAILTAAVAFADLYFKGRREAEKLRRRIEEAKAAKSEAHACVTKLRTKLDANESLAEKRLQWLTNVAGIQIRSITFKRIGWDSPAPETATATIELEWEGDRLEVPEGKKLKITSELIDDPNHLPNRVSKLEGETKEIFTKLRAKGAKK